MKERMSKSISEDSVDEFNLRDESVSMNSEVSKAE
jgi:hypothetical protein